MKQKKIRGTTLAFVLCILVILVFSITACGKSSGTNSTSSKTETAEKTAWAPKGTVKTIVTFGAGGGMDTIARTIASFINLDGQTMYITNLAGAGGCIGIMEGYHSTPDGYTLMIGSPEANVTNYISGSLKAPANKDMIYIGSVAYDMNVLCTAPGTFANWSEFVAAAKAKPGKLNIASVGSMNSMQASITDVLLKANIKANYVPYDSASKSRTAAMGKKVDALWCQLSEAKPYLDSGELIGIAIAAKKRTEIAPNLPTFSEMGITAVSGIHRALLLPPKTPTNIVAYYEKKIKEVYDNPKFKKIIQDKMGYSVEWIGTKDMVNLSTEIQAWGDKYMKIISGS